MTNLRNQFGLVHRDQSGVTVIEFAMIAPVFLFMLLGTFEIGYKIYMRSALNGAIQQAARNATLQDANDPTARRAIDDEARNILKAVNGSLTDADIQITRKSYLNFSNVERIEDYTDSNNNGTCDNNEPYVDENGNGTWGSVGRADNGGARDAVLYSITVKYESIFPLGTFVRDAQDRDAAFTLVGLGKTQTLSAQTLLKNQPFGDQTGRAAGVPRNCTTDSDVDDSDGGDYEDDYDDSITEG
jgi:TadE-like protein